MPYDEKLIADAESLWNQYRQSRDQIFKKIGEILIKLNNDKSGYQTISGEPYSLSPLIDLSSNKKEDIIQSVLADMKSRNESAERDKNNKTSLSIHIERNKYSSDKPYPQKK